MKEKQTVKGINIGGRSHRLIADKKDAWPGQMRKCKVWWAWGGGSLVQLGVLHAGATKTPLFSPSDTWFCTLLRDYKLSSPSVADRMIMEHSFKLFLIHASCDKGGTCFFFHWGQLNSLSWDHGHVTWDFHTMASSYLNPLIYGLGMWCMPICNSEPLFTFAEADTEENFSGVPDQKNTITSN